MKISEFSHQHDRHVLAGDLTGNLIVKQISYLFDHCDQYYEDLISLAQGHNCVIVLFQPVWALRSYM